MSVIFCVYLSFITCPIFKSWVSLTWRSSDGGLTTVHSLQHFIQW